MIILKPVVLAVVALTVASAVFGVLFEAYTLTITVSVVFYFALCSVQDMNSVEEYFTLAFFL
jgi:hypothetical protein